MEKEIIKESMGHLGVICSAPSKKHRRSHIRRLTPEQKREILISYKKRYEEYQRKVTQATGSTHRGYLAFPIPD